MSNQGVRLIGETMFDRFIIRTVLNDTEISVRLHSGSVFRGFITGVDEKWLQITSVNDDNSKMIQISSIQEFSKTNTKIQALSKEKKEKMRSMTHAIKNRCVVITENAKKNAGGRK